ncbi:MAG TPA: Ppx/GppA phosphatase family protein [Gammaproteobacteria bacterium]|nr:Ppx/GppA phosphatase family protein [Gammaproteobacteria bacterium]
MPKSNPATIAAVDLGSNSFHLVVAHPQDGHLKVIDRLREVIRLAAGFDAENRLSEEVCDSALRCLTRFGERIRHLPPGAVRAVGTNALRKARNAASFVARAEAVLGHPIDIVSGYEEARLIYLGVSHGLQDDAELRLVIDIGGGSTEVITGRRFEPEIMESLHIGSVGMSVAQFCDGTIDARRMRAAEILARQEFEPIEEAISRAGWQSAIGASGTMETVAAVLAHHGWAKDGITREGLLELRAAMIAAGHVERLGELGVPADRRAIFPGGVAIALGAFEELGIERMRVSDSALREGLLYDLLGRIEREDVRERTVAHLMQRFDVDRSQVARVRATVAHLCVEVAAEWKLKSEEDLRLLEWAAALHEIGNTVSHSQYHKHGAYLLHHLDMPGFARGDQNRLATLVRAHRRKIPLPEFAVFPQSDALLRLALLLRLAVVLHRARGAATPTEVHLKAEPRALKLVFPKGWLETHPLTSADLAQEADYVKAIGYRLKFK